jgi:predicted porin
MRLLRILIAGSALAFCAAARAVYAPIPDQEQGKALTLSAEAGISYNSNIFGAATDPISSMIYELSPKLTFNTPAGSNDTFYTGEIHPTFDYFENRPGTKEVDSFAADGRVAHSFSAVSVLVLSDSYSYDENPEALLSGAPINTDQTIQSNEFNARYSFSPTEKLGLVVKARSIYYDYINRVLGDELNRFENLYGLEGDFALLPEFKLAGEYRHQDVDYRSNPGEKNKHTDFLMAGFDYSLGPQLSASVRVGGEFRHRAGLSDETTPYVEVSGKYDYAKGSFVSVGYTYSLEETSDPIHFSDERVNNMFINVQHAFSPLLVGSVSLNYEPATLHGLPGTPDVSEDTTRAGLAVTYLPTRNWSLTASYDYDFVDSGLSYRGLNRSRLGVSATVEF